jgi:molybdopterin converting factor subunit 1
MTTPQPGNPIAIVVHVKLFALAAERAGAAQVAIALEPGATVADLRHQLAVACPALESLLPHVLIAVNARYVGDNTIIPVGAELACIPPVSGG